MTKSRADLHNHLRTSSNIREQDFYRAIDLASQRLGEYGIFALVNFADKRYEHFIAQYNPKTCTRQDIGEDRNAIYIPERKVLIVKGQEVPTKQGHLLVLGLPYNKHIKQHQTLEDTIKQAMDLNAIKIADHPFFKAGIGPYLKQNPELIAFLDGIETHNGEAVYGNKEAEIFHRLCFYNQFPNLGGLSSSDGHSFDELGRSWTEIDFPDITDSKRFVPSLRKSIRSTNPKTPRQEHTSYFGCLYHLLGLAFITKIAPKIGLAKMFETDRPE